MRTVTCRIAAVLRGPGRAIVASLVWSACLASAGMAGERVVSIVIPRGISLAAVQGETLDGIAVPAVSGRLSLGFSEHRAAGRSRPAPPPVLRGLAPSGDDVWVESAPSLGGIAIPKKIRSPRIPGLDPGVLSRRQAVILRRELGPEAAFTRIRSSSQTEYIDRDVAAATVPLRRNLDLAVVARRESFRLDPEEDPDDTEAFLARARLRLMLRPDDRTLLWSAVEPYGGDADGIGFEAGGAWTPRDNIRLAASGGVGLPWEENTLAVDAGGRQHRARASAGISALRFYLSVDAGWNRYEADDGDRFLGDSREAGIYGEYALLTRPGAAMGRGFRDPAVRDEETMLYGLSVISSLRWKEYDMEDDETVPVIPESLDVRLGLRYTQPLSRHLGARVSGFVGQDKRREIPWGRLYGWDGRFVFVPNDRFRLWTGYSLASESSSAVGGGRTQVWQVGMNANF